MSKTKDTPELFIKRPYYGAYKEFGWTDKDWGWGFADDKLDTLEKQGKQTIYVVLGKPSHRYKVKTQGLREAIKQKGSYNRNGKFVCGYLTEYEVAKTAELVNKG